MSATYATTYYQLTWISFKLDKGYEEKISKMVKAHEEGVKYM